MFTGIVEELGEVELIKLENQNKHFIIKANMTSQLKIDQSVSHNGICLTVIDINKNTYTVTAINETLQKTNFKLLKKIEKVNLETPLKMSDGLDGHIVQGHVDTVGIIINNELIDENWLLEIKIDKKWMKYCILKGSIAIDGISLTIAKINEDYDGKYGSISISIIPHTLENTNLQFKNRKDTVNIETDFFAKYIEKLLPKKEENE